MQTVRELERTLPRTVGNNNRIVLAGDFNCPDVNWENATTASGAADRPIQQALVDVTTAASLTQVHAESTRQDAMLDLVFMSNPTLLKSSVTVPGISDHNCIVTDIDAHPQRVKEKPRRSYKFTKAKWEDVNADLHQTAQKVSMMRENGSGSDAMWTCFKMSLLASVEKNIPSSLRRNNQNLPWVDRKLKKLLDNKKRLFKQAKKTKNWKNFHFAQKECRRKMRTAESNWVNRTIEDGLQNNDSKPFWKYVKAKRQDNTGVAPLKKGGTLISNSVAKAKILLDQFQSVFTKPDNSPPPTMKGQPYPSLGDLTVDVNGVAKLLKNLKPNKASGPDSIPNRVLKTCADAIAPSLTAIFSTSLETGELPSDWLAANVAAVFKKGDRHRAENYRPVSLTSVACKLLEHIVCRHLLNHLERQNILSSKNHGFRSGFSCETQLLTTMHDLFVSHEAGRQTDIAILDFSKAFDTVPHDRLLLKLDHYGVRGPIYTWLTNFLTKRKMRVVLEGEMSGEVPVESGVPQGTVLGPLLFLLHINDLPDRVKSTVRLFADDCLLYREILTPQDHDTLQQDLRCLETWAKEWGMRFNASKCYILSNNKKTLCNYCLDGVALEHVKENPYLGIQLSSDLMWSTHISSLSKKTGATVGFLRRNLQSCPQECRRIAYIALVRSTLEYGAAIWDPFLKQDAEKLERIQRQGARFIKRDYRSREPGCVTRMLQELQLPLLEDRRRQQRLTMLHKIANKQVPGIPPDNFLRQSERVCQSKRKIKPTAFPGFEVKNPVMKQVVNNTRGFAVPTGCRTKQYANSFFVKTPHEWNMLNDDLVTLESAREFAKAVATLPATMFQF